MTAIPFFPLAYQTAKHYINQEIPEAFIQTNNRINSVSSEDLSYRRRSSDEVDRYYEQLYEEYSREFTENFKRFSRLPQTTQVIVSLTGLILVLIVAYCLGHLLSYLSSFILESFLLAGTQYYPSHQMLFPKRIFLPQDSNDVLYKGKKCACAQMRKCPKSCAIFKMFSEYKDKKLNHESKLPNAPKRLLNFLKCPFFPLFYSKGEQKRMKCATVHALITLVIGSVILTTFEYYSYSLRCLFIFIAVIVLKLILTFLMRLAKQWTTSKIIKCHVKSGLLLMKYFFFPIVFLAFNLLAIPSVIFLGLIDRVFSLENPLMTISGKE